MFQLIVAVVSVGLTASLAIMSIYLGSSAFDAAGVASRSNGRAQAAGARHEAAPAPARYVTVGGH